MHLEVGLLRVPPRDQGLAAGPALMASPSFRRNRAGGPLCRFLPGRASALVNIFFPLSYYGRYRNFTVPFWSTPRVPASIVTRCVRCSLRAVCSCWSCVTSPSFEYVWRCGQPPSGTERGAADRRHVLRAHLVSRTGGAFVRDLSPLDGPRDVTKAALRTTVAAPAMLWGACATRISHAHQPAAVPAPPRGSGPLPRSHRGLIAPVMASEMEACTSAITFLGFSVISVP